MKNTKMKKFLAVVLSAALVAGLAAGCGSKEDGKEEDKGSSAKTAKVIDVDLTNEEYAFGIDKDQPELVEQVNAFIKEVKEDGTLDGAAQNRSGDDRARGSRGARGRGRGIARTPGGAQRGLSGVLHARAGYRRAMGAGV